LTGVSEALPGKKNNGEVPMPMQREIQIPQAMQRHTGCAWVHPARAEDSDEKEKTDKSKPDPAVSDSRALDPNRS
jgi:hypothetical protein